MPDFKLRECPFCGGEGFVFKSYNCDPITLMKHVDVVRCRECIHRYMEDCPMYFHSSYWHEGYEEYVDDDTDHTEDDYFCPKGKRKGDVD